MKFLLDLLDIRLVMLTDNDDLDGGDIGLYIELSSRVGLNLPGSPTHRKILYRYDQYETVHGRR